MKKILIAIMCYIFATAINGCAPWKKTLAHSGGQDSIFKNCITDFMHTRLVKKYDVFTIVPELVPSLTKRYPYITIVTIFPVEQKFFAYLRDTVGLPEDASIPTRYMRIDNKLFLWMDSISPITEEIMDVYRKYDLLDKDWLTTEFNIPPDAKDSEYPENRRLIPPYIINDALEVAHYYVCKFDYTDYIKEIGEVIPSYKSMRKLKCKINCQ